MRSILTFVFLSLIIPSFAQDTVKAVYIHSIPNYHETYSALKDDKSVRHGFSRKVFIGYTGYQEEGHYHNNKQVGVWKYSGGIDNAVEQIYDFDKDSLIFSKPFDSVTDSWILSGDSVKENATGMKPILLGGDAKYRYYMKYFKITKEARADKKGGVVFVSARVTADGRLIDEKLEKKFGKGMDEEAMNVIKLLPDEWLPLKVNGKAVDSKVLFRMRFRMER